MGQKRRRKARATAKRRGYEFSKYHKDGLNFKVVANTERSALFQAKEGSEIVELYYDKETGRKITRRLENPFV